MLLGVLAWQWLVELVQREPQLVVLAWQESQLVNGFDCCGSCLIDLIIQNFHLHQHLTLIGGNSQIDFIRLLRQLFVQLILLLGSSRVGQLVVVFEVIVIFVALVVIPTVSFKLLVERLVRRQSFVGINLVIAGQNQSNFLKLVQQVRLVNPSQSQYIH